MFENILMVISTFEEIKLKSIIPHQYSKNFKDKINLNPGYLFVVNKEKNELYVSEMVKIEDQVNGHLEKKSSHLVLFALDNRKYKIYLKADFQEVPFEVLKLLYSKNQSEEIGNEEFSIYSTIKLGSYDFARPLINDIDLFFSFYKKNIFREKLLYNNSIFSTSTEGKIYAELLEEDDEIFFSLTNDKMLKEDLIFLEIQSTYYRPYFYEFYFNESYDLIKTKIPEFELGGVYEVEINKGANNEFLNGQLIFSASPLTNNLANLKIKGKLTSSQINLIKQNDNIIRNKILTADNEILIENSIMNYLPNWEGTDYDFEITILNVGQGNWSIIKMIDENNKKLDIVFDIGIGNASNPKLIEKIAFTSATNLEKEHIFILSHWDLDHIRGVIYLTDEQFKTTWIVPELPEKVSFAALRLAAYLKFKSDISEIFVSEKFNNKLIFKNRFLMLGKGEGLNKDTYTSRNGYKYKTSYTKNNNLGLLLSVENEEVNAVLFSGDCEYIQFPNEFLKSYSSILISHHGAKIQVEDLEEIGLLPCSRHDSKAVVCVGKKINILIIDIRRVLRT